MRVKVEYSIEEDKDTHIDIDEAELIDWLDGETSYSSEDVAEFLKVSGDLNYVLGESRFTYVMLNRVIL